MALDSDRLGNAMAAKVQAARPADGTEVTDANLQDVWKQVATEIINELKQNGVVTVQTSDGPASGTIQ